MDKPIHVIVAENDGGRDPDGPLVFEQYTNKASKKEIEARVKALNGKYGDCKIARLLFEDEEDSNKNDLRSYIAAVLSCVEPRMSAKINMKFKDLQAAHSKSAEKEAGQ